MARQLAIIRNAHVRIEDRSMKFSIFFDTYINEGRAAMQIVLLPELPNIPGLAYDASKLDGRPCWVEVNEEARTIVFVDWWHD